MNIEEAIETLLDIYPSPRQIATGEYPNVADAIDDAIKALRAQQARENPQALTLEQLQKGDVLWVKDLAYSETECLLFVGVDKSIPFGDECHFKRFGWEGETVRLNRKYKDTWIAYRYPPKEDKP